jgi:hypothetical protein
VSLTCIGDSSLPPTRGGVGTDPSRKGANSRKPLLSTSSVIFFQGVYPISLASPSVQMPIHICSSHILTTVLTCFFCSTFSVVIVTVICFWVLCSRCRLVCIVLALLLCVCYSAVCCPLLYIYTYFFFKCFNQYILKFSKFLALNLQKSYHSWLA